MTCLWAGYRHYGVDVPLHDLIAAVKPLSNGGTLAVLLTCDALRRGFRAESYPHNLHFLDRTGSGVDPAERLREK